MYDVVVEKFTTAISSPDEFLFLYWLTATRCIQHNHLGILLYRCHLNLLEQVAYSSPKK